MSNCIQPLDKNGELIPKIRRFCEYYVSGKVGSVSQCLVKAGYSLATSKSACKQIMTVPQVQEYISYLDSKIQMDVIAEAEDVLMFWSRTMGDDDAKTSDRIAASKLLAEYFGMMDKGTQSKEEPTLIFDMGPAKVIEPAALPEPKKAEKPVVEIVDG